MIILVDQDGCLADFEAGFFQAWCRKYPDEIQIEPRLRNTFRIKEQYPQHLSEEVRSIYRAPGFFLELEPIPGAVDSLHAMVAMGHEVRICTAPLRDYRNAVEKYRWVERHLGREFTEKIILTQDKTLVKGDVLIDDNPSIVGCCVPEWRHLLFEAPYNSATGRRLFSWANWRNEL